MTSLTMGGILIDRRGRTWPDDSWELAKRIGLAHGFGDVASFAVRERGFIHLKPRPEAVQVAIHAGAFQRNMLAKVLYAIGERRPRRIALATFSEGAWYHNIFDNVWEFAEYTEDLSVGGPIEFTGPVQALERNLTALASAFCSPMRPMIDLWHERRGELPPDFDQILHRHRLTQRAIQVLQRPGQSRYTYEWVGAGIGIKPSCASFGLVGRDVDDLPDRPYGAWVAETYMQTAHSQRPRLESVRAVVHHSEGGIIHSRYNRLLLPWRRADGGMLILGLSMVR